MFKFIRGIFDRLTYFFITSPTEVQNRHRLIFVLLILFCIGIGYELYLDRCIANAFDNCAAHSTVRENLIKTFSNTITWLIGIYVAGAVASDKLPTPPKTNP
jgi:hypothetical protein